MFRVFDYLTTSNAIKALLVLLFSTVVCVKNVHAQFPFQSINHGLSVQIVNESPESRWEMRLAGNGDTVFRGSLAPGELNLNLVSGKSYHISFYMNGRPYSKEYFVNSTLLNTTAIHFSCSRESVATTSPDLELYSEYVKQFTSRIWSTITKPSATTDAYKEIGEMLNTLESRLMGMYYTPSKQAYIRSELIEPVRTYLASLKSRIDASLSINTSSNDSLNVSSSLMGVSPLVRPLSKESIPNESYLMIRGIAYASAYKLPVWLTSPQRNSTDRISGELASMVLSIVGESCACEVGYGLFFRTSIRPGTDFSSCSDSLPSVLLRMAESDSTFFCGRLKADLTALCEALATTTLSGFSAVTTDSIAIDRVFSKDSIYVLHFWGTWCRPCIDGYDLVQATSDTLESIGCKLIHVACENEDRFSIWKKFVKERKGEQVFTGKNGYGRRILADQLAISAYPTLLIVGRDHKVLVRDIEVGHVVDYIRSVQR